MTGQLFSELTSNTESLERAMDKPRLLIVGEVDDLQRHFEEKGYEVDVAGTLAEAREKLTGKLYDLALCDWTLPDGESLPLLAEIRGGLLRTEVVMTGKPPAETAPLEAVKLGIYGHLERPFHLEDLARVVEDTLEEGLARQQDLFADALLPQAVSVLHELRASRTILLRGERGTGKARVARMVHDSSERERPFLAFDCAGLSEPEQVSFSGSWPTIGLTRPTLLGVAVQQASRGLRMSSLQAADNEPGYGLRTPLPLPRKRSHVSFRPSGVKLGVCK